MRNIPYYYFWHPLSGIRGGLILGAISLFLSLFFDLIACYIVMTYAILVGLYYFISEVLKCR